VGDGAAGTTEVNEDCSDWVRERAAVSSAAGEVIDGGDTTSSVDSSSTAPLKLNVNETSYPMI
jgi:hypothetical protein